MADQIQVTVYKIDDALQQARIPLSILTRDIKVRVSTDNLSGVNSIVYYYDTPNATTQFKKLYVSEQIDTILSLCNDTIATQVKATVITINGNKQVVGGIKHLFPIEKISIFPFSAPSINSFIEFKGDRYFCSETKEQLENSINVNNDGIAPGGPATGDLGGTYPNPTVTGLQGTPVDATPPVINQFLIFNGLAYIPTTISETVTLGSLNSKGVWYPLEYIGPSFASQSYNDYSAFGNGTGFYRVPKTGILANFKYTNASPSGSNFENVQIYKAPNGDPNLLAFTGVTLGILAGAYISSDNIQTLDVTEDDIIVLFNNDAVIGYTPSALTITAELFTAFY